MSNLTINIEKELYRTHFVNMMPQRGFLTSEQSLITSIDIDLNYDNHFFLKIFQDDDIKYIFAKNGPIKINPYQNTFTFEIDNDKDFEYFNSCNFYSVNGNYIPTSNCKTTFLESNHKFTEIKFNKDIEKNKFIYSINKKNIEILTKNSFLIYSPPDQLDPKYSFCIFIDSNLSSKKFYCDGYESILSFINKQFKKLQLSGRLYKTKNGLRIILNDKFRDISKNENINSIIQIFNSFLIDDNLLYAYQKPEKRLSSYLMRLTPKFKNYKLLDNSYEEILNTLESINLSSLYLEKGVIPSRFDFKTLKYNNKNTNKFIDYSFETLGKMILKYLKNDSFAVCSFIKSYNYNQENDIINKFIIYHDQWTKANFKNTILI